MIGDLHKRNIMCDSLGKPCVVEALIGSIPPAAIKRLDCLSGAIADAREFRVTGMKPQYDLFDGIDDEEL